MTRDDIEALGIGDGSDRKHYLYELHMLSAVCGQMFSDKAHAAAYRNMRYTEGHGAIAVLEYVRLLLQGRCNEDQRAMAKAHAMHTLERAELDLGASGNPCPWDR